MKFQATLSLALILITLILLPSTAQAATLAQARQLVIEGKYTDAITVFEQVRKNNPQSITPLDGDQFGAVYGMAEDPQGHMEHCKWIFNRFPLKDNTRPENAERTAKAYIICATATNKKLLSKSEDYTYFAATKGKGKYVHWFYVAHGIAHYRLKDYNESNKWLRRALENSDPNIHSLALAYQAMNIHKRGYKNKALDLLKQAENDFDKLAKPGTKEYTLHWSNVLTSQLAIEEAKALLQK